PSGCDALQILRRRPPPASGGLREATLAKAVCWRGCPVLAGGGALRVRARARRATERARLDTRPVDPRSRRRAGCAQDFAAGGRAGQVAAVALRDRAARSARGARGERPSAGRPPRLVL